MFCHKGYFYFLLILYSVRYDVRDASVISSLIFSSYVENKKCPTAFMNIACSEVCFSAKSVQMAKINQF